MDDHQCALKKAGALRSRSLGKTELKLDLLSCGLIYADFLLIEHQDSVMLAELVKHITKQLFNKHRISTTGLKCHSATYNAS